MHYTDMQPGKLYQMSNNLYCVKDGKYFWLPYDHFSELYILPWKTQEAACKKALFYTPMPSFKSVKTILSTGQDKVEAELEPVTADNVEAYGFTRGASYYGRTTR